MFCRLVDSDLLYWIDRRTGLKLVERNGAM